MEYIILSRYSATGSKLIANRVTQNTDTNQKLNESQTVNKYLGDDANCTRFIW